MEAGCPAGRLYRECRGEGCPYSCAHLAGRVGCAPGGCPEGCHCPGTHLHRGACLAECPCELTAELLRELLNGSAAPPAPPAPPSAPLVPGQELPHGTTVQAACGTCLQGRLRCGAPGCRRDGGFGPWGPWSRCSRPAGGWGVRTRRRGCTSPPPAHGGRDCAGPRTDTEYCRRPPCPAVAVPTPEPGPTPQVGEGCAGGCVSVCLSVRLSDGSLRPGAGGEEEEGWGPWSPWGSCSGTCTRPVAPAARTRTRSCRRGRCGGESAQQRACNLPHCAAPPGRDCRWTPWGPWGGCSRSCGGGLQLRLRAYTPPGPGGRWCPQIRSAHLERRLCALRPCQVDGAWSPWGPWSRCDRTCGGGRSVRSRSCTRPPPKNGGQPCPGERHLLRLCNPQPCGERCPPGTEPVPCATRCPRHCRDLREGLLCGGGGRCQPGCRCPNGTLEQDGGCVPPPQCECTDAEGRGWAPGSRHRRGCESCACRGGVLRCAPAGCPSPPPPCAWSRWSRWGPCSVTCGGGAAGTPIPAAGAEACGEPEEQSRGCSGGPCPPLCPHAGGARRLGESWPEGECRRCTCTPEGPQCQDTPCAGGCRLSPWSPWSPCSATCGGGISERRREPLPGPGGRGEPCDPLPLRLQRPCSARNCSAECPGGRVYRDCATGCPRDCAHLRPGTRCLPGSCEPGCACPPGQVLQDGVCVPPELCRCLVPPALAGVRNLSQEQEHPPGTRLQLRCNTCVCVRGAFNCSQEECDADCLWSPWSPWSPCSVTCGTGERVSRRNPVRERLYEGAECLGPPTRRTPCRLPDCPCPVGERWRGPDEAAVCERSCGDISGETPQNCSGTPAPGCACQPGRYRNGTGHCVPAARCECRHRGRLREAGSEWQEGCERCRCAEGRAVCAPQCPPLACPEGHSWGGGTCGEGGSAGRGVRPPPGQGAVKVREPGGCCPVCREEWPEEDPPATCRRRTEVRALAKGRCRLPAVEVAYCAGRCRSRTTVTAEEPYLQSRCECCSYRLDPDGPVRVLRLPCPGGGDEPVVLPVIRSCQCSSCQAAARVGERAVRVGGAPRRGAAPRARGVVHATAAKVGISPGAEEPPGSGGDTPGVLWCARACPGLQ
ncbi:LOW QUALITY PROTEIN: SCO-spondin-like [Leptosomus discolor]